MYLAIKAALSKSDIPSQMAREVRNASNTDRGAGILVHLHYQRTSCTAAIVEYYLRNTPIGKIVHTCIVDIPLDIGLYGPL